ncbi:MurR/RpiR family transcriptional regulator [uncultured Desulfobacter sp.]|uniref:MurR/RpiR family transcriptional regulator n=1 Tax=uncultured Desulfobacter sp. TaxID=240139 RepID=UPI0029F510F4|nr:MurR/RpiR family transcriptional regulator [uncultured Desulfobacter sp.]
MNDAASHPVINEISLKLDSLTPKARTLGTYIIKNPSKVVFMTTKELAEACGVSEATVVRFVSTIGYSRYSDFQEALKDFLNTGLSLPERLDIKGRENPELDRLHRGIIEELVNLQHLYEHINVDTMTQFVDHLESADCIYFTGSRISYTFAYYFGWSLTKVRRGIHILKGSDSTTMDMLNNAPENNLVVLAATTRYPNELIRLSKMIRRAGHTLLALTDSSISPVIQFADLSLVVPSKSIPFIGNVSGMLTVIQCMVQELANRKGADLKNYQEQLEQMYLENDILFNLNPK